MCSCYLYKLYNNCLAAFCSPAFWKYSFGVPVFKNSIILLPLSGKVLQAQTNTGLVKHLTWHEFLSDTYGFRFAKSAADVLKAITEFISLENNGENRAVALDIPKAFDRAWLTIYASSRSTVSWDEYLA